MYNPNLTEHRNPMNDQHNKKLLVDWSNKAIASNRANVLFCKSTKLKMHSY